jgi:hypothetical protein
MNINKKIFYLLVALVLVFIFLVLTFAAILSGKKVIPQPGIAPTPTPFKKPIPSPFPSLSASEAAEFQVELNYALERKKVLEEKPWLLKLPLEGDEYFIVYDTEKSEFHANLYFYEATNSAEKEKQILNAKEKATQAIKNLGIDLSKEKISFDEIKR